MQGGTIALVAVIETTRRRQHIPALAVVVALVMAIGIVAGALTAITGHDTARPYGPVHTTRLYVNHQAICRTHIGQWRVVDGHTRRRASIAADPATSECLTLVQEQKR